jgi:hypothetical protein
VEWQTDTSVEAAQKRIQEQLTLATSEMVMLTIPEEDTKQRADIKAVEKTVSKNTMAEPENKPAAENGKISTKPIPEQCIMGKRNSQTWPTFISATTITSYQMTLNSI